MPSKNTQIGIFGMKMNHLANHFFLAGVGGATYI
jgi:hypothetical protein